jgi:uncharacterized membrane protein YsdA (DUF1294 family)/cold shock CspA family protein
MRFAGTLTQWNDERGFGWIEADDGGERLFVHINAFEPHPPADQRPRVGQRLQFAVGLVQGRKRAVQVTWRSASTTAQARDRRPIPRHSAGTHARAAAASRSGSVHIPAWFGYGVLCLWLALLLLIDIAWGLPQPLWLVYAALGVITFMAYWRDKWAAQQDRWRTSERALQLLALLGGWPGAVLAQQWLRHKSSKASFQAVFWCMVVLHAVAVLWLCSPAGRHWRR